METVNLSYQELVDQLKRAEEILDTLRLGQADAVIGEHKVLLLRLREADEELQCTIELLKESMEILEVLRQGQADAAVGKHDVLLTRLRQVEEELQRTSELFKQSITGANNYLTSPIYLEEVRLVAENVSQSVRTNSELEYLRDQFWKDESRDIVRTHSPKMQKVFDQIQAVAPTLTTVLLTGETGTGKGVMAKLLHRHSQRSNNQFISVHCGAIPETLIESELFGHEKGAFTGAIMKKLGKFEIAQGGTLFLDEIGTVTQSVQIKLLQVLQEKIFGIMYLAKW
jgi:DNA-binding NtrC family response regulator